MVQSQKNNAIGQEMVQPKGGINRAIAGREAGEGKGLASLAALK